MLLQEFGLDAPNHVAACQQISLCACVYRGDLARARDIIAPQGEVLVWQRREESWPASYVLIRQDGGGYYLVIEGTTNVAQWIEHPVGVFYRSQYFAGCHVNGAWMVLWLSIKAELAPFIQAGLAPGKLHISGHSYGGALAQIAALDYLKDRPDCAVRLLTFAQPKALTVGYSGPEPACYWRYVSDRDLVPSMPPDYLEYALSPWTAPIAWLTPRATWSQYGVVQTIYPGGEINYPADPPEDLGPRVTTGRIEQHLPANYWGRMNQWNQRFGV